MGLPVRVRTVLDKKFTGTPSTASSSLLLLSSLSLESESYSDRWSSAKLGSSVTRSPTGSSFLYILRGRVPAACFVLVKGVNRSKTYSSEQNFKGSCVANVKPHRGVCVGLSMPFSLLKFKKILVILAERNIKLFFVRRPRTSGARSFVCGQEEWDQNSDCALHWSRAGIIACHIKRQNDPGGTSRLQ